MTTVRSQIHSRIAEEPGIHFNALRRGLDLAMGQVQYHTRVLERDERIVREEIAGRAHFFLPIYGSWEREAIALLRRETTRELIIALLSTRERHPQELADQLSLARSTIEWHLSTLIDADIVEKERMGTTAGNERLIVRLTHPETTYRLLREIEPGRTDRLVDRFMRLTDELLE